ncbi:MAG: sulfotransferase [Phycisphaerales bacterium]|nr:sulfotransferase [Phycisphaerales bacterium]
MVNAVRYAFEYAGLGDRLAPFPIRRLARPWTLDDLPPRKGLTVAPPDFVGVGTQKSGTSWWAALIEAHPGVAPNLFKRKEMHYLTHFFDRPLTARDIETYHAAFARPEGRLCGEWTPNYLASPYTIRRLDQAAPDAKVLVMFRDPVARYESGFNHEYKQRFGGMIAPGVRSKVIRGYALRKESIWNGMYAAQCDTLLRIVPRERLLVLQYEQCKARPRDMIARTYRFLGLDESFVPGEIERPVNVQRQVTESISDEARNLLREIFADDAPRLAAMFPEAIDLSLWPGFENRPAA